MRVPATAEQGLLQLHDLSGKWLKFFQTIWHQGDESVLQRLTETPIAELSSALLPLLRQARDLVQQVGTSAAEIAQALAAVERKARQGRKG